MIKSHLLYQLSYGVNFGLANKRNFFDFEFRIFNFEKMKSEIGGQ
jgi:hypothetical protein